MEETFTDHVSGGSRTTRTALATMLGHARRGDTVRVKFVAGRLTVGPGGEDAFAVFQLRLLGAAAQLERSLIRERQREGTALAKQCGVYRARARRLDEAAVVEARRLAAVGVPRAKIARDLGCPWPARDGDLAGTGAHVGSVASAVRDLQPSATVVDPPVRCDHRSGM